MSVYIYMYVRVAENVYKHTGDLPLNPTKYRQYLTFNSEVIKKNRSSETN